MGRRRDPAALAVLAGEHDASTTWLAGAIENHRSSLPGLVSQHVLEGRGHWLQQEAPAEVNRLLVQWLTGLRAAGVVR